MKKLLLIRLTPKKTYKYFETAAADRLTQLSRSGGVLKGCYLGDLFRTQVEFQRA